MIIQLKVKKMLHLCEIKIIRYKISIYYKILMIKINKMTIYINLALIYEKTSCIQILN